VCGRVASRCSGQEWRIVHFAARSGNQELASELLLGFVVKRLLVVEDEPELLASIAADLSSDEHHSLDCKPCPRSGSIARREQGRNRLESATMNISFEPAGGDTVAVLEIEMPGARMENSGF